MAYYNVSSGSKKPVQIMRQGKPISTSNLNVRFNQLLKDPWVGTAIDLHTEFPMSGFDVRHEDVQLEEFFNKVKDDTSLESFVMNMVSEYFIVGEAIPLG